MGTVPIQILPNGYYSNLLTSLYKQTPEFNAWINAVLSIANDTSNFLSQISAAFDPDYAIGVQLDIVGLFVGVSRTVPFQPSDSVSPVLDDETYRILIKATIANNQWDGKIGSLYPIWNNLFPGGHISIVDNQDMTADIVLTGSFTSIIEDLINNGMIVPRPQAVEYNISFADLPMFGFDRNDSYIAGWDTGNWS